MHGVLAAEDGERAGRPRHGAHARPGSSKEAPHALEVLVLGRADCRRIFKRAAFLRRLQEQRHDELAMVVVPGLHVPVAQVGEVQRLIGVGHAVELLAADHNPDEVGQLLPFVELLDERRLRNQVVGRLGHLQGEERAARVAGIALGLIPVEVGGPPRILAVGERGELTSLGGERFHRVWADEALQVAGAGFFELPPAPFEEGPASGAPRLVQWVTVEVEDRRGVKGHGDGLLADERGYAT